MAKKGSLAKVMVEPPPDLKEAIDKGADAAYLAAEAVAARAHPKSRGMCKEDKQEALFDTYRDQGEAMGEVWERVFDDVPMQVLKAYDDYIKSVQEGVQKRVAVYMDRLWWGKGTSPAGGG